MNDVSTTSTNIAAESSTGRRLLRVSGALLAGSDIGGHHHTLARCGRTGALRAIVRVGTAGQRSSRFKEGA
jgi:hypothetical protein